MPRYVLSEKFFSILEPAEQIMKFVLTLAVTLIFGYGSILYAEDSASTYYHVNNSVPNVIEKLSGAQKEFTIGWLGGSITAGAGSSSQSNCYRELVMSWFRENFPNKQVNELNAAMGGTGSVLGAFRVYDELLKGKSPDIIFVEFAVNDAGTPEKSCVAAMEGIVRRIWAYDSGIDIVFVYTSVTGWFDGLLKGNFPESMIYHQKVADYYGIPTINVGTCIARTIDKKELTLEEFSKDGVHPTDAGYKIYADAIDNAFKDSLLKKEKHFAKGDRIKLPPLSMVAMEPGRLVPATQAKLSGNWLTNQKSPAGYFKSVIENADSQAELEFFFSGRYVGIFDIMGPDSGAFEYSIDGTPWRKIARFDQWSTGYYRPNSFLLADNLSPFEGHVLKLRAIEDVPADSKGNKIRIGYFLVTSPDPSEVLPAKEIIESAKSLFEKDGVPEGWRVSAWDDVSLPPPEGAVWQVKEGILHGSTPRGTWFISGKEYGDFYIEFEFLLPDRGNSGFGVHFPDAGDPAFDGMEIQMCDPRYYTLSGYDYKQGELTGGIYEALVTRANVYRPEQWNKYQINIRDNKIAIVLNGEVTVKTDLSNEMTPLERGEPLCKRPKKGHLGFQELARGGDHVRIRNIRIYEY